MITQEEFDKNKCLIKKVLRAAAYAVDSGFVSALENEDKKLNGLYESLGRAVMGVGHDAESWKQMCEKQMAIRDFLANLRGRGIDIQVEAERILLDKNTK